MKPLSDRENYWLRLCSCSSEMCQHQFVIVCSVGNERKASTIRVLDRHIRFRKKIMTSLLCQVNPNCKTKIIDEVERVSGGYLNIGTRSSKPEASFLFPESVSCGLYEIYISMIIIPTQIIGIVIIKWIIRN